MLGAPQLLAGGAFGKAYRVTLADGTVCVRKTVRLGGRPQPRLMREVEALQALRHANIIEYIAHSLDADSLHIDMQYADQGDLRDLLRRRAGERSPLSDDEVLVFFHQMCFGVRYLHRAGYIHRDLKPANIFLITGNHVKVGDFGASRLLPDGGLRLTAVGTPGYMAPEVLGRHYDEKADVWSLGCILYELCTFRQAFPALEAARAEMWRSQQLPDMAPMARRPREFAELVRAMLNYEPDKRPSAADILEQPVLVTFLRRLYAQQRRRQNARE
jgi:NIMA (never in mitosis gene a)-related kinase